MSTGESFSSNSGENSSAENTDNNGWSNFPPFNGGEKLAEDTSEISEENQSESGESLDDEDMEYIDISKIDISSNQGKYEWLDSLVENCKTRVDDEYYKIIREEGLYGMDKKEQEKWLVHNDAYQDNRREYDLARRQSNILENLDIDGEGGVLGALERKRNAYAEIEFNPKTINEDREAAYKNYDAANNLYFILAAEMARRDPEYFGYGEIKSTLESDIEDAEKRVDRTMVDGYFGEDGFIHTAPNGEKMPGPATEDAEIDLKYAKQDAETFNLLARNYGVEQGQKRGFDFEFPRAVKKTDFASTIDNFIKDHTVQINQLLKESESLTKGTPEYAENQAKRRKLASERSSARRLSARYFNVPKDEVPTPKSPETSTNDNGMKMEQMPAGKTKEQIEAEAAEKKRKEEEYQKRVNEYWEQKRQAEQKQREENERQIRARQEAEAERQRQIREAEEAIRRNVNQQQFEEEQEEGMSM